MMEENLFKDVQVVAVAANEEAPDLVYIDDEEEETRTPGMTAIQIELREEDPKRSSTPYDSDNDILMGVKNTPNVEEKPSQEGNSSEITESYKTCIIGSDYLKTEDDIDEDCSFQEQEQFEIVENAEEKDTSTDSTNDSTRANKSNESNDHSYSQPPPKEANSFCDDIVKNILQEANLSTSKNAIVLLKEYTKFFENLTNEHQHSQLSLYLKQMMFSLSNNEDQILLKPEEVPDVTVQNKEDEICDSSKNENNNSENVENQEQESDKTSETMKSEEIVESNEMEVSSADISIKSDIIQVKQEVMETDTGNMVMENKEECNINGTVVEGAEKLKVYVKKAQEKTAEFCENNQKLIDSVFVSEEDVENGNSKFRTSLYSFISFNVALLMAVENKSDEDKSLIDEEINKIKRNILKSRRTSRDNNNIGVSTDDVAESSRKSSIDEKASKSRKSSVSSLDKDLSESDSDSSINRLTNLKSLDQRRYETQKSQNAQEKPVKTTQKAKKKTKENSDDSSINSETSESESESPKKKDKSDDEDKSSEDEELKLKQKLEMKARDNLLASSDDDEDEESYVTSQTSEFSSDDERNVNKSLKKKKHVKKLESSDEEMTEKESKEPASSPNINGDIPQVDITPVKSDESMTEVKENGEDKKSRKRHRKSSFEREIFDKSLLNDSDDESSGNESDKSDGQQATKKLRKGSRSSSKRNSLEASKESVVDLTQQINIRADRMAPTLEKYLEKISSNVDDLTNAEQPSSSTKAELSPKKNDQQKSSKAPSPSLDDIDCISISSESDSEISSTISEGTSRRRKQLTEEELKEETKKAKRDENERVKKLEDKEKRMSQYLTQRLSQSDVIAADELVLDYSEEKDLAVVVHETLVGKLKDHQVDGIKFMYNNCYGSVDEVKENNGSGCILAHCMGLGKTLQLIALLHTVTRYPELHTKRILIICPKSTIHNWVEEFRKWLNGLDNKPVVIYLEDNLRIERRIDKLREWYESKRPSVFLINYESFRILANWSGSHKRSKIALPEETTKKYKQQISKYLLNPGPHIAICDEGHIIKNQKGATNRAITKITTRRRIILTGTPVQNALHEYYAMVEWIKPNILGTIHEFNNIYANPIKDGQNKDSTDHQIKKMKQKSYVLNKNLSRFVQRKDAQVLKEFLPMKYEYCISIPLTKVQERLYNSCLQANRDDHMGRNLLPIYTALRKIWTHPRVLQYAYERAKKGEHKFGSAQQQQQQQQQLKEAKKSQNAFNEEEGDEPDDIFDTSQGTTAVTNNWWNSMLTETDMNSLTSSHKMILLFEILRLCEMKKEKILIFSSFVAVLDIIEGFMKAIHNQDTNPNAKLYGLDKYKTTWELGKDYFRLDGSTPRNVRQEMINAFNNSPSPRLRCFLISAKAGGQGINLVAANRCIIIDTSWNPANDNQNIFRIFRLGQKKTCYVYRLVAASTMEERVYSRSVTKEAMSHRVVEKKQIDRHYVRTELEELFVPYELKPQEKTPNFPSDDILRYLLHALPKSAYNFHEHDSLLENKPDQELNEDEKNEAWNSYLAELQGNRYQLQNNNPNANNAGLAAFGKSPITADFMKLYQDMLGPSANYGNLAGLMPTTSGLDSLGLSSSYFPMSSGFYTHDLLKRFGNYDPLNIYSTSLPTSSNIHSTSSTSPLMQQSVLRNSHNPISALGNMAVAATSSYNANNIPPASNSIFAPPVSNSSNINQSLVPTMMPYTAQTSGSQINKNLPKKKVSDLGYNNKKDPNKNGPIPTNLLKRTVNMDPLIVPPNSSENLSILPDDQSPPKSIAGTSARTLPKVPNDPKKVEKVSLVAKSFNAVKGLTDKILNQRSLIRSNVIMTKAGETNKNQGNASIVAQKPLQSTVIQKPTNSVIARASNSQVLSNSLVSDVRKLNPGTPWLKPTNNKTTPGIKKQNLVTVSPAMKAINRQLDKSPITAKLVNMPTQQKQANPSGTQIINLGNTSNDSISIIRLPPKTITPAQSVNKSQSVVTPNLASQQKVTNPRPMQPAKQIMTQNNPKTLQQQPKRVIDNQTNQTLKRIKIADSMSLSQNSQQIASQRLNSLQMESQRSNAQVLTQRPNANQAGLQRISSIPLNSQVIQNLARVPKPSQQSNNKNTNQAPEVVEVD